MCARASRPAPPERGAAPPAEPGAGIVQQVLAERRELMIANERLRMELDELRGRGAREDPRLKVLEMDNRALRDELAAVRAELDLLERAVAEVVGVIQDRAEKEQASR